MLDRVKKLAKLDDSHDEWLSEFLPILEEWVKDYCNQSFKQGLPKAVELFIAQAVQFNMQPLSLKARSMGSVSYSYATEFPETMLSLLRPYRKVRFRAFR